MTNCSRLNRVNDPYRVEPLGGHDRAAFMSGKESLDRYIREQAGQDVRRRMARVYVLIDVGSGVVAGYYTLSNYTVEPAALPSVIPQRLGRYPSLPATLVGRLALDQRYQARKLGGVLLRNALKKSLEIAEEIASCGVVVDAIDDDARGFYEHFGFTRLLDQEYKLFIPMDTVRKLP